MHSVPLLRRLAPLAAVLLAAPLVACGATPGGSDDGGKPVVAAAFYPLAWAAERVAGEHATVENLTSPGGEPHDLELSIQQTALVSEADLVVFEHGFQPAVDASVEENASGAVLDATEAVELRPAVEHDHHEEEGHEDHAVDGGLDPHFWLDPLLMADLADAVAASLAEADPAHAQEYEANAADVRADLETLDGEYADGLARCERDTVVVTHDAFGYLDRYGVHMEPILGLSPGAEPSPATLATLRDLIEEEGITTVFSERLLSAQTAKALATEAGVGTAVLDPLEGLGDETADEDYLSLMRANLQALREANGC
ncbi:MAG TPA: metal ABC transporter substrate-binding protein [Nocardioides sp.]